MFNHRGLPGYQDLPEKSLTHLEKYHPESLEVPNEWSFKQAVGTWEN